MDKDPLHLGSDADQKYRRAGAGYRGLSDKTQGGVLSSIDQLKGAPAWIPRLRLRYRMASTSPTSGCAMWRSSVPRWAANCAQQAGLATLYSLLGMLVYLGFRFEWIYGVAAVVTVFHDTLITVGAFSLPRPIFP